jgi:hypothetical protein
MQVIVMTSDNYYNCLTPFMYLWLRFFTFCGFTEPGVELLHPWRFVSIGKFEDYPAQKWSDALLWVLDNVAQDRFVLMLEDYWLCRPVDVRGVKYLYDYADQCI